MIYSWSVSGQIGHIPLIAKQSLITFWRKKIMRFAQSGARCGPQQEFHCRNYPRHTRNPGPPIGHVTAIPRFWLAETLTTFISCVPGQNLFRINHPNYLILSDAGDCKLAGSGLVSCEPISFLIGHSAVKLESVWQEEELGRCIWS